MGLVFNDNLRNGAVVHDLHNFIIKMRCHLHRSNIVWQPQHSH